ncbi:MAG: histidine kinase [Bacteroidia bacterium]|nr:histidine kinase [Bacteroidia bacterium]
MSRKLISFFCLFFFLVAAESFIRAQNNCNCPYADKIEKEFFENYEKRDFRSAELLLLKLDKNSVFCRQSFYSYKAILSNGKREFDSLNYYLDVLRSDLSKNNCLRSELNFRFYSGYNYLHLNDFDSASYTFIKASEIALRLKDEYMLSKSYSNLGVIFNTINQPHKSVFYYKKALSYMKKSTDLKTKAQVIANLATGYGRIYDQTSELAYIDSAKKICMDAVPVFKADGAKLALMQIYNSLAGISYAKDQYDIALKYLDSTVLLADKNADFDYLSSAYYKYCDNYIELKQYAKAKEAANTSFYYAQRAEHPWKINVAYERLIECETLVGNYRQAMNFQRIYSKIKDSLFTAENSGRINELEQKYNKAQNEKTINDLNQEKEITSLRMKFLVIGIFSALLVILVIVIFYRQSVLKNKQRNMEVEQRLNRARMNPHFFFNTLNSLQTFSMQENKNSKIGYYLSKYARIMRQTLESTYKETTTVEQEIEYLNSYMDIQKLRYPGKFEFIYETDDSFEAHETLIPGMIIQPFLENAIEHGFNEMEGKGIISLKIKAVEKKLQIEIEDNGSGFTEDLKAKEYPSRATQIIKDRLYLLDKQLKTTSAFLIKKGEGNKGTYIKLVLPLMHKDESTDHR